MANTSEKLTKLKERYKDKSLTRSQRQELMREIIDESYRLDKRPVMSIRDYQKKRLGAGLLAFVSGTAAVIGLGLDIKTGPVTGAIALGFGLIALGLLLWFLVPTMTHKLERGDELSERNEAKANEYTAATLMMIGFMGTMLFSMSDLKFTVSGRNIFFLACAVYGFVMTIKCLALLKFETPCPEEDEEDED